jgi:4-amino-4-deoxy-L-arabinose transferase-like glycosyltransferase
VLAVAAAVRLRRRPDLTGYLLCGLTGALAVGSLQSGVAVLLPFAAAFALRERAERRWLEPKLLIPLSLMALSVRGFWPFAFVSVPAPRPGSPAARCASRTRPWPSRSSTARASRPSS